MISKISIVKINTFIIAALTALFTACHSGPPPSSVLISNVRIVDGSGAPAYEGAVRIDGDRITEVGTLRPLRGETVIDGQGQVLAPGFIDTHSHHDEGMFQKRELPEVVSQGVTTIVIGQDGDSVFPLQSLWDQLDSTPVAVNIASYAGHNTLRREVMPEYARPAGGAEVERMGGLLQQELAAGAVGLSTGLEYDPGIYSTREEVLSLAKVLADNGRRYISHLRSEDRFLWEAVDEILTIGRTYRIPVQISHMKIAIVSQWGKADSLLQLLNAARAEGVDVSADVYPYEHWQSTMTVLFPKRDFTDLAASRYALTELTTPEGMIISTFDADTSLVGRTLADIAAERREDPAVLYLKLINQARAAQAGESIIAKSMDEEDVARLIAWPHSNVCSDGGLDSRHPRGAGSFTRVLRRYVREEHRMSLEEAVRQMTSLAAAHMGFAERGQIRPGYFADLILFNPDTVTDHATFEQPGALSEGMLQVWVNGQAVWNGAPTGNYPGKALRVGE